MSAPWSSSPPRAPDDARELVALLRRVLQQSARRARGPLLGGLRAGRDASGPGRLPRLPSTEPRRATEELGRRFVLAWAIRPVEPRRSAAFRGMTPGLEQECSSVWWRVGGRSLARRADGLRSVTSFSPRLRESGGSPTINGFERASTSYAPQMCVRRRTGVVRPRSNDDGVALLTPPVTLARRRRSRGKTDRPSPGCG